MKTHFLLLLEKLLVEKAVMRGLLRQYGLYEEKVQLRAAPAAGQFSVEHRCACREDLEEAGPVAGALAASEDAAIFEELARYCFPIKTDQVGIWLENFSDITEVALVAPANLLPFLASGGAFQMQDGNSGGFCGTYRKGEFYLPVYRIAEKVEPELLLLKTGKLGIIRQLIPLPLTSSRGVLKTIFHGDSANVFREILEYLPQKGFLGYVLRLPDSG